MKGKGVARLMKNQNNCLQMSDRNSSSDIEPVKEHTEELSEEQAFRPARNRNARLSWRHHYQMDISYASYAYDVNVFEMERSDAAAFRANRIDLIKGDEGQTYFVFFRDDE